MLIELSGTRSACRTFNRKIKTQYYLTRHIKITIIAIRPVTRSIVTFENNRGQLLDFEIIFCKICMTYPIKFVQQLVICWSEILLKNRANVV